VHELQPCATSESGIDKPVWGPGLFLQRRTQHGGKGGSGNPREAAETDSRGKGQSEPGRGRDGKVSGAKKERRCEGFCVFCD
jgi:hypothetical protein